MDEEEVAKELEQLHGKVEQCAWNSLVSVAEFYAQRCMNPHQTIIITQNGIELLSGDKAKSFELLD